MATVLRQSGGSKSCLWGNLFVFLKLPPVTCTIPGYEINLGQCHDDYNHTETSIKIIHDKHLKTRSRQLQTYGNQALLLHMSLLKKTLNYEYMANEFKRYVFLPRATLKIYKENLATFRAKALRLELLAGVGKITRAFILRI